MKERVNVAFKLHLLMLILGITWGMIVSAISPANASGELNLGLGLLYNMMWIPFFWRFMFTGVMKTLPPKESRFIYTLDKLTDTNTDELVIPETVQDLDGKTYQVTELGEGSVPEATNVTVGQYVDTVNKGAFRFNTNAKMRLTFQGPIKKGMFAKGAFQVELQKLNATNGKKKVGKNITIFVQSKKDMKQMKKQLKKAGIPGAKVKIEK